MGMIEEIASLERTAAPRARAGVLVSLVPTLHRYAVSAGGPVAVSGAHFLASLILLRALPPADFGLFSFLLIIVPFCLSLVGALVGAPFTTGLRHTGRIEEGTLVTHLKANLVFGGAGFAVVTASMLASGATPAIAALLGLYGGVMTLRLFGRTYAYAAETPLRALFCDLTYAGLLLSGLVVLLVLGTLTMERAAMVLAGAALVSFIPFGACYLRRQFRPGPAGSLRTYGGHWHSLARWAVLGVVLTEFTANAHAYIVTFVAGPKAFALLAIGSLVMRPASLVLSSLPDIERPRLARKIGTDDLLGAYRNVKDFRNVALGMWMATLLLAAGIVEWAPQLLLKKGYPEDQVLTVIAIWGVILIVRALRTPESVLLQAAGEFRELAGASLWSSVTAVTMTLGLLLAGGPIWALGGILAGDLVMTTNIFALSRKWKAQHD